MSGPRLIVMTRFPEMGRVKSRLAATVGPRRALTIHELLVRHTLKQVRAWGGDYEVRITGGDPEAWKSWLPAVKVVEQGSGDLGERMARAVRSAFDDGVEAVALIGTDCPGLSAALMAEAFERLSRNKVVCGPAEDGGYYLLALSEDRPDLFREMEWGTNTVLSRSLERAPEAHLLVPLGDVDHGSDLNLLERFGLVEPEA